MKQKKESDIEEIVKKDFEKFIILKSKGNNVTKKIIEKIFCMPQGTGREYINLLVEIGILKEYKKNCWQITSETNDILKIKEDIKIINKRNVTAKTRLYVWQRDKGKCVKCGSNEKLEYDHIIPFSKGGSCTDRNIQLLCEKCNRKKLVTIE